MVVVKAFLLAALATTSKVVAHGIVDKVIAEGVTYNGYNANNYLEERYDPVGWKTPTNHHITYIPTTSYGQPDIICHLGATPANHSVTVKAGDQVKMQWTKWPSHHHGPVLDYLASCNGPCSEADKLSLKFNKIDEKGRISDTTKVGTPGVYASDELIAAGNSWMVTIPSYVAPGEYVLRHEIISLHDAYENHGAQNYPQCINLIVTGSGTDHLTGGTPGESLYKATDPGLDLNIYLHHPTYIIPGPPLYKGGSGSNQQPTDSPTATPSSTTPAATSSLPPTITPKYPQGTSSAGMYMPSGTAGATGTIPPYSSSLSPTSTTCSTHNQMSPTATVPAVVKAPEYASHPDYASHPKSHASPPKPVVKDYSTPVVDTPVVKADTGASDDYLSGAEVSAIMKLLDQILSIIKAIQKKLNLPRNHARDIVSR